ncbi:MAG TPA: TonB-dependent receptor, partial [Salinivirgaceae bacterium]|nr:TonB-dependent receptor [Salinivirgaceae bacterium]
KMVIESYYKDLKNLIPYSVDNVKIIYDGLNHSKGYAYGADLKVSGEFVKGVDSWISLSYLKTFEDIIDDQYINNINSTNSGSPGYIPRPTDQRFLFSMFFQDYWPGNPTIKVHLNTVFNTGLPVGPPNSPRYLATHRLPSYSRVDMGISKEMLRSSSDKKVLRYFESVWIGFEVFNVFDIENVISYSWITDIRNRQFGIPNTLTGRLFNLKINIVI